MGMVGGFFSLRFPAQGGRRSLEILIFMHTHVATERAQAARLPQGLLESLPVEAQSKTVIVCSIFAPSHWQIAETQKT